MDSSRTFTLAEVQAILDACVVAQPEDNPGAFVNRVLFRMSCCLGMRAKEIRLANVEDVQLGGDKPVMVVRSTSTKRTKSKAGPAGSTVKVGRTRRIPLWWDSGTYRDLAKWLTLREQFGPDRDGQWPLLCGTRADTAGRRMIRKTIQERWRRIVRRALGSGRVSGVHTGRHTFCSLALASGRNLVQVRDAAGHSNITTTSIYLHAQEAPGLGDVFTPAGSRANVGMVSPLIADKLNKRLDECRAICKVSPSDYTLGQVHVLEWVVSQINAAPAAPEKGQ